MVGRTRGSGKVPVYCQTCRARLTGLCEGCAPEVLKIVAKYKSGDREIASGQDLFSAGEPCEAIYNLVEGWVCLYTLLEDGRRQILHFALPGAVLGFNPGNGDSIATHGALALTEAVVCIIPHKALGPLSREHPEIGMRLAWLTSRDRSLSFDHLMSVGQQRSRERVARLLLELFVRARSQWPGHRIEELHLPLTQDDIGDATGLTGVHVNRVLQELRRDGVVEFHYHRLRVIDPDKLVDVAGVDIESLAAWVEPKPPS